MPTIAIEDEDEIIYEPTYKFLGMELTGRDYLEDLTGIDVEDYLDTLRAVLVDGDGIEADDAEYIEALEQAIYLLHKQRTFMALIIEAFFLSYGKHFDALKDSPLKGESIKKMMQYAVTGKIHQAGRTHIRTYNDEELLKLRASYDLLPIEWRERAGVWMEAAIGNTRDNEFAIDSF